MNRYLLTAAVGFLGIAVAAVSYLSYARALDFMSEMPAYKTRIQRIVNAIQQQSEQFAIEERRRRPSPLTRE